MRTLATVIEWSISFDPSIPPGLHRRFLGVLHPLGGRLPAALLHHTAAQLPGGPRIQEDHRPNQTEPGWVSPRGGGPNVILSGKTLRKTPSCQPCARCFSMWSYLDGTQGFQGSEPKVSAGCGAISLSWHPEDLCRPSFTAVIFHSAISTLWRTRHPLSWHRSSLCRGTKIWPALLI